MTTTNDFQRESELTKPPVETPKKAATFSFALPNVSETKDDFIEDPEIVNENVSESVTENSNETKDNFTSNNYKETGAESARGMLSDSSESFDPSIHQYPPKQTAGGKWRRKRKTQIEQEQITSNVAYDIEAQKIALLYADSHRLVFGDGGALKDKSDIIPLKDALSAYMAENGLTQIPPSLAVMITSLSYSTSVAQREENKERTEKVFGFAFRFYDFTLGKLWRKITGRKKVVKPKVKTDQKESVQSEPQQPDYSESPESKEWPAPNQDGGQ